MKSPTPQRLNRSFTICFRLILGRSDDVFRDAWIYRDERRKEEWIDFLQPIGTWRECKAKRNENMRVRQNICSCESRHPSHSPLAKRVGRDYWAIPNPKPQAEFIQATNADTHDTSSIHRIPMRLGGKITRRIPHPNRIRAKNGTVGVTSSQTLSPERQLILSETRRL